jgi:hypothetical protein
MLAPPGKQSYAPPSYLKCAYDFTVGERSSKRCQNIHQESLSYEIHGVNADFDRLWEFSDHPTGGTQTRRSEPFLTPF